MKFKQKAMRIKTKAKAIPLANSPLFVSREIAVVMVLVSYLIFPPTIIATPTSATMRP